MPRYTVVMERSAYQVALLSVDADDENAARLAAFEIGPGEDVHFEADYESGWEIVEVTDAHS